MPKADSSLNMLIVAALVALGIGYYVPQTFSQQQKQTDTPKTQANTATPAPGTPAQNAPWTASAPGRVEPMGGEIRISTQVPGRIDELLVGVNDKVSAGDLMLRLADDDLVARVQATRAEVAARKRERDNEAVGRVAQDRRTAEDNFANAERTFWNAREDLDRALVSRRNGVAVDGPSVDTARDAVKQASERLDQTRTALRKALQADTSAPTRLEAALSGGRAELSLAEAALDRTRIRAPANGTVLQLNTRVGETVAPSPEAPLIVMGDVSSLRVRAEFEERDIGKIKVGQAAVIRSDAYPGQDFEGKVSSLAQALGPSKLGQRGPRRPTDVDVLEVLIDLNGRPALLPGMRVDVFLKAETPGQPAAAATQVAPPTKTN